MGGYTRIESRAARRSLATAGVLLLALAWGCSDGEQSGGTPNGGGMHAGMTGGSTSGAGSSSLGGGMNLGGRMNLGGGMNPGGFGGGMSLGGGTSLGGTGGAVGAGGGPVEAGSAGMMAGTAGAGGDHGGSGNQPGAGQGGNPGGSGPEGGGPSAGAGGKPDRNFPALRFVGLANAVELAPVRLAAAGIYPGAVTIGSGGVDQLCGSTASVDLATNAETQLLRASANANCSGVRVIFTVCEGLYRIIARKSRGITKLSDLAGKRVMAPSTTSSHYFLVKMLALEGLALGSGARQVQLVSGSPNGSTFSGANAPDAATIWEPGIQQAKVAIGDDATEFRFDSQGKEVYRELFNLHSTAAILSDPVKRRAIVEFVRALIEASKRIRQEPALAVAVLEGPTGESRTTLEQSLTYERFAGTLVSDLLEVMDEEEAWRATVDNRARRSRAQLATFIDDSILKEALAAQ
ncbi:MAG TPA: ABC transporter substrate-binding protein [Polyangiaceae bacterium]|nr:ABC transporter substrate-binding protein [Polyangiaceae bacterium]